MAFGGPGAPFPPKKGKKIVKGKGKAAKPAMPKPGRPQGPQLSPAPVRGMGGFPSGC